MAWQRKIPFGYGFLSDGADAGRDGSITGLVHFLTANGAVILIGDQFRETTLPKIAGIGILASSESERTL